MKKSFIITVSLIFLGVFSGYAQLFPKVDKPKFDDASMLVLLFSKDDGILDKIINYNFSGWAPAVLAPDGSIVRFRTFSAGADITSIVYAENLTPGEYVLTGFYHVYTDFGKLEKYKQENGDIITKYAPYDDMPYHSKQHIPLKEPVKIKLEPNTIMSLGSYAVVFKYVGGVGSPTDDRYKLAEEETAVTIEKPDDDTALRYMKPWATPRWKKWNAKNPAEPLESD